MKSQIIAFEGLDCCFKETNYNEFLKRIKEYSPFIKTRTGLKNIKQESFPRYECWTGTAVRKWLNGDLDRKFMLNHPMAINSTYYLDRVSYWHETVDGEKNIDLYNEGNNLFVFDRYMTSSSIYNPIENGKLSETDFSFEPAYFGSPKPDIVVWLRMRDFEVIKELLSKKENKDKNELDFNFLYGAWERSEYMIGNSNLLGFETKLIVINLLDINRNIKSREALGEEIFLKLTRACDLINI